MYLPKSRTRLGTSPPKQGRIDSRRSRPLLLESLEERTVPSILFGDTPGLTVSDNGGPVLANAQVRLIFWGNGWNTGSGPTLRAQVQTAVDSLNGSTYFYSTLPGADLSQYRPGTASRPTRAVSITTTFDSPGATFTDAQVRNMLSNQFGASPNFYYYVIPDPNSTPVGCDCTSWHSFQTIGSNRMYYGFSRNLATPSLDDLTYHYSGVMAGSITDPDGTALQVNPRHATRWNEIGGSGAQNYTYRLNSYLVQSYWSRSGGKFTVPTGQTQTFFVSAGRVLTVNGDQLANRNDTIAIDNVNNAVRVSLNGEVAQFEPGAINSIVVNSGLGNDVVRVQGTPVGMTVNLGDGDDTAEIGQLHQNLDRLGATVSVTSGPGSDALFIDDRANGRSDTWTLNSDGVSAGGVTRAGWSGLNYSGGFNRDFRVYAGAGASTINVLNTHSWGSNLATGPGEDIVNVLSTVGFLNITALTGDVAARDTVNLGNGTVSNIRGALTISNNPSYTLVNVYAQNDAGNRPSVVLDNITTDSEYARLNGLMPGTIYTRCSDTSLLQIFTGTGAVTTNVLSTCAGLGTNLAGNGPNHVVNLGNAGRVQGIRGVMSLSNTGGRTAVNVNDQNGSGDRVAVLDLATQGADFIRLTDLAPAPIYSVAAHTSTFTVNSGIGHDTYHILGTALDVLTTVNGGGGDDFFALSDQTGTMHAVRGPLTLNGGSGDFNSVSFYDWASDAGYTYNFTGDTMTRDGIAPVRHSGMVQLVLYTGASDDRVEWGLAGAVPFLNWADQAGTDTLVGPDAVNTWYLIDGVSDLLYANGNHVATFYGVDNLAGGVDIDTFVFSDGYQLAGAIDGVGGRNALDYSQYTTDVYVNLQTGVATGAGAGIGNIYDVTGGSGNDILVGGGDNVLIGGDGRDLLIAGYGYSVLDGGLGDDLLVGGVTVYDFDEAALRDIRDGALGLDATTAFSNGGNTMAGGDGVDQFFGRSDLDFTDWDPKTEVFVEIG